MTVHGGDVWQICSELGIPVSEILDFSANINPRGLPQRAQDRLVRDASDQQLLGCYPDRSAHHLRDALAEQLAVPAEAIAIGPGAEALLSPVLRCLHPRRAVVPVPAFSEYRQVCLREQIKFLPVPLDRSASFRVQVDHLRPHIQPSDVVLLNNPHNPSGALLDRDEVLRLYEGAQAAGAKLLVDEAFIDYAPYASLVRDAAVQPGLVVVRSLTKFYGCPALRVGYTVAHPQTIRHVQGFLPTWGITQLAIDALAEAVVDHQYAEATLRENSVERERLAASLGTLRFNVFASAANYLFLELPAEMPTASELRARLLAQHRILIRNCDSYEGLTPGRYVRIAVRGGEDNRRLIQALIHETQS
jgi:threonine-phosphate decarboxylase